MICRRLREYDEKRTALTEFTPSDLDLKSPKHAGFMLASANYSDHLTSVLSELVHLNDNVSKWLQSVRQSKHQTNVIEKMKPKAIAGCFVNTAKHGLRSDSKNAVIDFKALIFGEETVAGQTSDKILDETAIINFDGKGFDAATIIDDLLQLWDLFLRYHTDVDSTKLQEVLAVRFHQRIGTKRYSLVLGPGFAKRLEELNDERASMEKLSWGS
ncbi:hypothetical protein [Anatilimnocola aggregata]|uniref:hypothetical protein n=1 Tax=Anatilimnocola aggregata TaxID=2528021 RepID=UPI00119D55C4|nr:hypothetical protein [Anatilimnocola aggregata]